MAGSISRSRLRLERRGAARHAVDPDSSYALIAAVGKEAWPARVGDISASGISLFLRQRVEPETVVNLVLANTSQLFSRVIPMRVVHVRENENGFIVGGQFTNELTYDELRSLLA